MILTFSSSILHNCSFETSFISKTLPFPCSTSADCFYTEKIFLWGEPRHSQSPWLPKGLESWVLECKLLTSPFFSAPLSSTYMYITQSMADTEVGLSSSQAAIPWPSFPLKWANLCKGCFLGDSNHWESGNQTRTYSVNRFLCKPHHVSVHIFTRDNGQDPFQL